MVEVTVDVAADAAVRDDIVAWITRFPQAAELNLEYTDDTVTATLRSPPQLATLVMTLAMFLRAKPTAQRPVVTVTASNGESLEVTTSPDPNEIRQAYIAMDKEPPPPALTSAVAGDIIDAEIADEPQPDIHQNSTRSAIDD